MVTVVVQIFIVKHGDSLVFVASICSTDSERENPMGSVIILSRKFHIFPFFNYATEKIVSCL